MARKKRLDVDEVLDRERAGCGLQEEQNIYQTAGYIRLSIEDSGKTNGYSLENQEKLVRDYIADRQDLRLYRLYIDNGATGTVFERPAFDEMMQDMKDGKTGIIWKPGTIWNRYSRFSGCGLSPSQTAMTAIPQM